MTLVIHSNFSKVVILFSVQMIEILISPSVLMPQHLLHACEIELNNIDMAINFKKIFLSTNWSAL